MRRPDRIRVHGCGRRALGLLALACALVAGGPALAQTGQEIASRRLMLDRADAARLAGRHDEALDLYARAGQLQMTPSVRAFVAEEQRQVGRLADALGSADLCLREVDDAANVRNREAIRTHCRALRDDLSGRVGSLVVRTPGGANLRVTLDGVELNAALYGAPVVVTPGDVVAVASSGGVERWRTTAHVAAGETVEVRVELPAEPGPVVAPVAAPAVAATEPRPVRRPRERTPHEDAGRTWRTLGWVAAGGAAAGVVAGTVALVVQRGRANTFNQNGYPVNACDGIAECASQRDGVSAAGTAAWAGYVGGAVLGAASVVLFLAAPSAAPRSTAGLGCGPGPGTAGVSCALRF